jgi:acetyl esterase/lipase
MKRSRLFVALFVLFALLRANAWADAADSDGLTARSDGSRAIPAHVVPLPEGISPFMRGVLTWKIDLTSPHDEATWLREQRESTRPEPHFHETLQHLGISVVRATLGGVPVFLVTPADVPMSHRGRIIDVIHGGGYVVFGGYGGLAEAVLTAHFAQTPVVAVDYRMPPRFPYPTPLDDSVAAYRALLRTHDAAHIAIVGTSAGGGLSMLTVIRLHAMHQPLPAVVALVSPWSDLSATGDTFATNAYVDSVLGTYAALAPSAHLFAGKRSLRDPAVSPLYATVGAWFPPTIVTTGTRDLFLSLAVRTYRKLVDAGGDDRIEVYEGMPHAFWVLSARSADAPEVRSANLAIARFLDRYLAR